MSYQEPQSDLPGPPPVFPPPPQQSPRNRHRTALWIVAAIAAVVVLAGGITTAVLLRNSPRTPEVPPGWQTVADTAGVWAVPPGWTIEPDTTPDEQPVQVAVWRQGYCRENPDAQRAYIYAFDTDAPRPADVTVTDARDQTMKYFTGRQPQIAESPITTDPDGTVRYTITATAPPEGPCDAPAAIVQAVGIPTQGQTGPRSDVLLIIADQGTPDSAAPADLATISRSFHKPQN